MDKVLAALAADTPPDLINNNASSLAGVFGRGGTVDVDAVLKGDPEWQKVRPQVYPNILAGLTWKGKVYAIPSHNSFNELFYNAEALKRAGLAAPPPTTWTWDDVVDYSRRAARPPETTGMDVAWVYQDLSLWTLNNGARYLSPDGTKFVMASPEVRETVTWLVAYLKSGQMRPHDGSANGGYKERMADGGVVFQKGVSARVPLYRQQNVSFGTAFYPNGPRNAGKVNYTPGVHYGFSAFKHKDARRTRAALLAALWAGRQESGMAFAAIAGVTPSYKNIVTSAEFQTTFKQDNEMWPFHEVLPNAVPRPNFPAYDRAVALVDAQLGAIWAGKVSVDDGLKEAERQGQQLLDEALRGG
jgi:sn-glycerol 3-phosphate transport system substrate-binding protein